MKAIKEVQAVIAKNQETILKPETKDRIVKQLKKGNEDLKQIILYLETNPNEEFIKKESVRLRGIIESKNEQFDYWSKYSAPQGMKDSAKRTAFSKEHGLDVIRKQLKMLNFLLDK